MFPGLELCEPSLRLTASVLAGLVTVAGELLLLAVALGCHTWRALLGVGAAPLTLFLSYGYHAAANAPSSTPAGFKFHLLTTFISEEQETDGR